MQLIINGKESNFDAETLNIAMLVEHLALASKRIAIECNGEIISRSQFSETLLHSGDKLEIVGAVGGG